VDLSSTLIFLEEVSNHRTSPYGREDYVRASFFDSSGFDTRQVTVPDSYRRRLDWKILPFITVGVDFTETIAYLDGISVALPFPDKTAKVFNVLGLVISLTELR